MPRLLRAALLEEGVPAQSIEVVPDEQEAVSRALAMAKPGDLLLVFADALERTWNQVVHFHPDTRLVICGTGPLLEELKGAARSAGVERHVDFTGLVDNTAIARYCAAADLFVLPSVLEAMPTVAVEALASGTPVLSTDNPGGLELNDLFGPDVAIVPREQPLALADAITRFLDRKRRTTASYPGEWVELPGDKPNTYKWVQSEGPRTKATAEKPVEAKPAEKKVEAKNSPSVLLCIRPLRSSAPSAVKSLRSLLN